MLRRLLTVGKAPASEQSARDPFEPCMPEVNTDVDVETVFMQARAAAAGELAPPPNGATRYVLVTPDRNLNFYPCPPFGTMDPAKEAAVKAMVSPAIRRSIVAIAYTDSQALRLDSHRSIPLLDLLVGLAYIGHSVWIFEGHPTALAAGCRTADVLLVDGAMVPHLMPGWATVAAGVMHHSEIYVYERASGQFLTPAEAAAAPPVTAPEPA